MRVGTRASPLAQAQADRAMRAVPGAQKVPISSEGDQDLVRPLPLLDARGAFTAALTQAVLDGRVDAAVHSLKDLPLEAPDGAPVVAVLTRDDPADMLLLRGDARDGQAPLGLRRGARVGTSAPRRRSQLQDADASLVPVDVRGNVQTRLKLLAAGVVDGLLMAAAVFERIDLELPEGVEAVRLDPARFPGSPGQGTIAVQSSPASAASWADSDHEQTRLATQAERRVLGALGGGCGLPLGVFVRHEGAWVLDATFAHGDRLARAHTEGADLDAMVAEAVQALQAPPAGVRPDEPPHATETAGEAGSAAEGQVILMSLPEERTRPYRDALAAAGRNVLAWPLVATEPTGAPMPGALPDCEWIVVTSPRAVPFAAEAAEGRNMRVAAVGPATARALRDHGLPVHLVARDGTGADLAENLLRFPTRPEAVLWPCAQAPAGGLREGLEAGSVEVVAWHAYRTLPAAPATPVTEPCTLVLCSPSAVAAYRNHPDPPQVSRLVAFGPTTAAGMEEAGMEPDAVCAARDPGALREALV